MVETWRRGAIVGKVRHVNGVEAVGPALEACCAVMIKSVQYSGRVFDCECQARADCYSRVCGKS
jgi:hypothetical protein